MTVSFTAKQVTTKFIITGQVQGVGFRPFIFRIAKKTTWAAGLKIVPVKYPHWCKEKNTILKPLNKQY